jgi:hypothetical protein
MSFVFNLVHVCMDMLNIMLCYLLKSVKNFTVLRKNWWATVLYIDMSRPIWI